jgi:hypothetical protein
MAKPLKNRAVNPPKSPIDRPERLRRIVGHADVLASELKAHPLNFRVHPDTQRAAVAEAIDRLGWIKAVLVNRSTGRILDGHLRVEDAAAKGQTVPVDYVELTEAEERLALASLDPLTALAVEDADKLAELVAAMELESDSALDIFLQSQSQDAALLELLRDETGSDSEDGESEGPRIPHGSHNIAVVIPMADLALFERAILAANEPNRGNAIAKICRLALKAMDEETSAVNAEG